MQAKSSISVETTKPSHVMQGICDVPHITTPANFSHEEILEKQNQFLHIIFNIQSSGPEITQTKLECNPEIPGPVDLVTENSAPLNVDFNFSIPLPVKTQVYHKMDDKLLSNLHILQCIHEHTGPIWTMKFSYDGSYLCTAGRDAKLMIWQVGFMHSNTTRISRSLKRNTSPDRKAFQRNASPDSSAVNSKHVSILEHLRDSMYLPLIPEQRTGLTEQLTGDAGDYSPMNPMHSFHNIIKPSLEIPISTSSFKSMELFPDSDGNPHYLNNATQSKKSNLLHLHEFIQSKPYRVLKGHDGDIVDISWSKSMFLLSASIDKTVRLWHISKDQCLRKFLHPNILTTVEFHPDQDRYFITGCFDKRVRVWDIIPEGSVREWKQTPDVVTAMQFSPDGKHIAAGLINGQVFFYDFENLKYITQMNCRNRSGKYAVGSKVTSLQYLTKDLIAGSINLGPSSSQVSINSSGVCQTEALPHHKLSMSLSANKLLVSTNDSSVRLYSTMDYSLQQKYKGLKSCSNKQIKSSFCENRNYVISGSDDGKIYIWKTILERKRSAFLSMFTSSSSVTSTAVKNFDYESFDCIGAANLFLSANNTVLSETTGLTHTTHALHMHNSTSAACIIGMFCPSRSVENVIINHPKLMSLPNYEDVVTHLDCADLCSRLIVTADDKGRISVFLRGL